MSKEVNRGYVPTDEKDFNEEGIKRLTIAQEEVLYLIERGYPLRSVSIFVGNHHMLSERQRLALVRATAERSVVMRRREKMIVKNYEGHTVWIDGLNLIITLEVALSESTLVCCMDGTIRDLAGLRGTYRLIDKTDLAIHLIGEKLISLGITRAVFYLDSPVSNTGRLKQRILELLQTYPFEVVVELVNNADVYLEQRGYIITSDAIILNKCHSWINLAADIIKEKLPEVRCVELNKL